MPSSPTPPLPPFPAAFPAPPLPTFTAAAVVVGSFLVSLLVLWLLVTRAQHDRLLRAMLPDKVIQQLQDGESDIVQQFSTVTILFSDIVGCVRGGRALPEGLVVVAFVTVSPDARTCDRLCKHVHTFIMRTHTLVVLFGLSPRGSALFPAVQS